MSKELELSAKKIINYIKLNEQEKSIELLDGIFKMLTDAQQENARLAEINKLHINEIEKLKAKLEKCKHDRDRYAVKIEELRKQNKELKDNIEILEQQNGFECGVVTELQQELAELKANGIFPRYKIGQQLYWKDYWGDEILTSNVRAIVYDVKTTHLADTRQNDWDEYAIKYEFDLGEDGMVGIWECDLYTTESEALEKLRKEKV